jgi:hypothetical protein
MTLSTAEPRWWVDRPRWRISLVAAVDPATSTRRTTCHWGARTRRGRHRLVHDERDRPRRRECPGATSQAVGSTRVRRCSTSSRRSPAGPRNSGATPNAQSGRAEKADRIHRSTTGATALGRPSGCGGSKWQSTTRAAAPQLGLDRPMWAIRGDDPARQCHGGDGGVVGDQNRVRWQCTAPPGSPTITI